MQQFDTLKTPIASLISVHKMLPLIALINYYKNLATNRKKDFWKKLLINLTNALNMIDFLYIKLFRFRTTGKHVLCKIILHKEYQKLDKNYYIYGHYIYL